MKIINTIASTILCLALVNCHSFQNSSTNKIKIEQKLDSTLKTLNQNGKLNGNVLVTKNKKIIYNKSFGFSDGTKKTLLKQNHRFNIGSIYKEIPAIAIMQLSERKLLSINEPISKYLTKLPNWSNQITIQHLLQYTSGLPKISWGKHQEISDKVLMQDLLEIPKLKYSAGKNYTYTNYSPFLLSKIVESISKKDFKSYVRKEIFNPLKLKNSNFNLSLPYQNKNGVAISFDSNFVEDNPPFKITSPMFLFSTTTEDLYNLVKGLHSYKLINQNSLELISKTANLPSREMESPLGHIKYENNKIISHVHHGSSGNYEGIISIDFKNNITIVVLTNNKNGNVYDIVETISELIK